MTEDPPPGRGGWNDGDPPAARLFAELGPLRPEFGGHVPAVRIAYETWGSPRRDGSGAITNAVLVEHALTGDAHVTGPAGPGQPSAGWWGEIVGSGRALDTDDWFVVCANVLGGCQGSTGPASTAPDGRVWGSRFPRVSIRDQVVVEARLADHLGIARWAAVLGGSMGGMRVLEWLVAAPERVGSALVLATCAAATADQIGTQTAQQLAITADPHWRGGDYHAGAGPVAGLGIARRIAHLTYRSERELDDRFGRITQDAGYAVQSYLDHHADKLARRFDAGSYVALTQAMNDHDLGRGRGGVARVLAGVRVPTVVAGIDTDRLYPLRLQQRIAALLPGADGLQVIASQHGHDGFLIETGRVGELVVRALRRSPVAGALR